MYEEKEIKESEKLVPNDLEEAGREYREGVPIDTIIYYCGTDEDVYFANRIVDAFIAGADWQKEQMMKEAVEAVVSLDAGGFPFIEFGVGRFGLKVKDKVKVIIVKEDSHE